MGPNFRRRQHSAIKKPRERDPELSILAAGQRHLPVQPPSEKRPLGSEDKAAEVSGAMN